MSEAFRNLQTIIGTRRNTKPQQMNGNKIPAELMESIIALADFAPTHGVTEPWRFIVYSETAVQDFCMRHAHMYEHHTSKEKFEPGKFDKLRLMGDKASHIVVAVMQRGNLPKIPAWEEKAATACAVQNMLLGATALGIASYWGSGGMAQHPAMKEYLGFGEADFIMGILYFGYADQQPKMTRSIPMKEKVKWIG